MRIYGDRAEAGQKLGEALKDTGIGERERGKLLILAIPRGGVVVGAEVSQALDAPLDVWLARKIGAPGNSEFAIGSVSSHGELLLDESAIQALGLSSAYIEAAVQQERQELERRMVVFRGHAEPVQVEGKIVVLVDDGVATGSTALSALAALRRGGAAKTILAVPVAPSDILPELERAADEVVVLNPSSQFYAVGQFYEHFEQVPDEVVIELLENASRDR